LVLIRQPQIAARIRFDVERAGEVARLVLGNRNLRNRAGTRIQLADKLLAEIRKPNRAVGRPSDVVRLREAIRDIVLRDDDVRRRAFEPATCAAPSSD
jgi:hypothetical protein